MQKSGQRARKKVSSIFIITGLLLIAAALFLTGFNLYDEYRAERSVDHVLEQMKPQETHFQEWRLTSSGLTR